MFQGQYEHSLDGKGRLILPVRIREDLGSHFVLTKGMDGCLYIFPPDSWDTFSAKLQELPSSDSRVRRLVRHFIGSAVVCDTDKQRRFLISPVLRNYAGIEKDVTVIGVTDRIELWAASKYSSYEEDADESIEDIAGSLVF